MENSISRILIETVVRRTLKDMKENPERSIRNLVDTALHFPEGNFQKNFFQTPQTAFFAFHRFLFYAYTESSFIDFR